MAQPRRDRVMSSPVRQTMTLYSGPLSMFGAKCQIAAVEKGLPVQVVMVPFTTDHRYEPKHREVLRVFMAQLFAARLGAPMSDQTPRLLAWRLRVAGRAAVRPVVEQFIQAIQ